VIPRKKLDVIWNKYAQLVLERIERKGSNGWPLKLDESRSMLDTEPKFKKPYILSKLSTKVITK
jgi:hypothetical protein